MTHAARKTGLSSITLLARSLGHQAGGDVVQKQLRAFRPVPRRGLQLSEWPVFKRVR